eukprot:351440-Chlamydomonas_euryale.AAC.1
MLTALSSVQSAAPYGDGSPRLRRICVAVYGRGRGDSSDRRGGREMRAPGRRLRARHDVQKSNSCWKRGHERGHTGCPHHGTFSASRPQLPFPSRRCLTYLAHTQAASGPRTRAPPEWAGAARKGRRERRRALAWAQHVYVAPQQPTRYTAQLPRLCRSLVLVKGPHSGRRRRRRRRPRRGDRRGRRCVNKSPRKCCRPCSIGGTGVDQREAGSSWAADQGARPRVLGGRAAHGAAARRRRARRRDRPACHSDPRRSHHRFPWGEMQLFEW